MNGDGRLKAAGIELLALAPERAVFRLAGVFRNRLVRWRVELAALGAPGRDPGAQYIEIGEAEGGEVPVRVGLWIPEVDAAAVLKAGIMLRNYRRLRPGRHEWKRR